MGDTLPPMAAMRAFEAAARLLSFTRAAEELGMTQAAISYQIKVLEERVGTPLFLRLPRQVALSEAGQQLAPAVIDAFERMRTAFAATRNSADGTLVISSVPTIANQWLVQHLGLFNLAHPNIAVRLDSTPAVVDFSSEPVDVGIRGGKGVWPGLASHLIARAHFTPMLSPALAASVGGLKQPADLLALPFVDQDDPWASKWFEAEGVQLTGWVQARGSMLGSQNLSAAAAIAGRGVAFLTPKFFRSEIAEGRLVQPFPRVETDQGYWLVYPEGRRNLPKIRAFRDWILSASAPLRE